MSACIETREALQDALDGPIAAERLRTIEDHLRICPQCRDDREGLLAVRSALRSVADVPLPEEALELVWARTIRSGPRPRGIEAFRLDWRLAAAAAAVVTLLFLPPLLRPVPSPYGTADLSRAEQDARRVLALTARALRKTERAAVDHVLAGEVSHAMRKIPIRWSPSKRPDSRRSHT